MSTKVQRKLILCEAKKETRFAQLQQIYEASKNVQDPIGLKNFKTKLQSFERLEREFSEIVEKVVELNLEITEGYTPDFRALAAAEELCDHIRLVARDISLLDVQKPVTTTVDSVKNAPRLPRIQIPNFDGKIQNWPIFYEMFLRLVDQNPDITDTDRIHYLINSLTGIAHNICSGIPPVGANYLILWNKLIEKYQNKRLLANTYFEQMLSLKPFTHESSTNLNLFLEKFDTAYSALRNLDIDDLADYMVSYIALSKFVSDTARAFGVWKPSTDIPKYEDIVYFVKIREQILSSTGRSNNFKASTSNSKVISDTKAVRSFISQRSNVCPACNKQPHHLYHCSKFLKMTPSERFNLVKSRQMCYNCLSNQHNLPQCNSKNTCSVCHKKHHSLLHLNKNENKLTTTSDTSTVTANSVNADHNSSSVSNVEQPPTSIACCNTQKLRAHRSVLLSTVVVHVTDNNNVKHRVRFLLDSASQANFITVRCSRKLKLPIQKLQSSVQGIGLKSSPIRGRSELTIESRLNSNYKYLLDVLLLDQVTDCLPSSPIDNAVLDQFKDLFLADDCFHIPGPVDGIIGASLFPYLLRSFSVSNRAQSENAPIAIQSVFGYIIMGSALTLAVPEKPQQIFCSLVEPVEVLFKKFLEIEDVTTPQNHTNLEDEECERIFVNNCTRGFDGRYTVALPFKTELNNFGNSFLAARKRLFTLEKRFDTSPEFRLEYNRVMQDYIDQNHMSLISDEDKTPAYFIPHHGVFKADSTSTPLRVVFDASARTDNHVSLNDVLYTGKKLQVDLFCMLLKFRLGKIAISADIRQMYKQIWIKESHRRYQCILWRFSNKDSIKTYKLNTVTFRVKSSPYLAIRTVHQLLHDEQNNYPFAAKILKDDLYMDDLVTSLSDLSAAKLLHREAVDLFKTGGFELLKWSTNSQELLAEIPESIRLNQNVDFNDQQKILGLQWSPCTDIFKFKINSIELLCTKRNILSVVARLFDPLGLIAPVTLYAKLLIKQLWTYQMDWDETPPMEIVNLWESFKSELPLISTFTIDRHLSTSKDYPTILLGFADACETSYGAMIYSRTYSRDSGIKTLLICAKSKVSPLKTQSIPRLELCAAYLLSKLLNIVISAYQSNIVIENIYAFSDSTVVLSWINASPHRWTTFVSNRVAKIQELIPTAKWLHIAGKNNPSDCLSRGLTPAQFMTYSSWVSGPDWIKSSLDQWPVKQLSQDEIVCIEEKKTLCQVVQTNEEDSLYTLIQRCSSWLKLMYAMVYVLRFTKLLPSNSLITASDIENAEVRLLKLIQRRYFLEDLLKLENNKEVALPLRKLRPFLKDGLIRVGGRLSNSDLSYDNRYPILLPKQDHFVNLLITYYHNSNLHAGPSLLLSLLRQKYWILSARSIVRKITQSCNICFRTRPKSKRPLLGDLPAYRVQPCKAFLKTGVDYTGAIPITLSRHRGVKTQKAYICLFVCLTTKAIHLELVSELSTEKFLDAFKRFLSRRGPCNEMYSDQGTNFIGAKAALNDMYQLVNSDSYNTAVNNELTKRKITWNFIPPAAPSFGGLWESNIKCVKSHLFRCIGEQILSYEELNTVLTQIEALLNSRPLCVLSTDPSEPLALTPAHFLTLTPLQELPAKDVSDTQIKRLDRFRLIDRIVQDYWKRWSRDYLHQLQSRDRYNSLSKPLTVGTVVVLEDSNSPPLSWPLGIIDEIFPGKDGIIRVVTVRTKKGCFRRPVTKVCPLPTQ